MQIVQLKIKIKSLAAEARIIKEEEKKLALRIDSYKRRRQTEELNKICKHHYCTLNSLILHRTQKVRVEARHALIVYQIMKGDPYKHIEEFSIRAPDLQKLYDMALRFGINKILMWRWILEAQEEYRKRGWPVLPVRVVPSRYIMSTLHNQDKVNLTQKVLDDYCENTSSKQNLRTKVSERLAKWFQ